METKIQRTLIICKHDAVARGLMGEIIKRFERVGLKLVAMEFIAATEDMGNKHYPTSEEWLAKAGNRTLTEYKEKGIDAIERLGTDDAIEVGKLIKQWNVDYLSCGPVLAMVWEGPEAIAIGRKLVGETLPVKAAPGTIRGDFGVTVAKNIIHGSDSLESAEREIAIFFKEEELVDYSKLMNEWIY